jgi:hypothetical protein
MFRKLNTKTLLVIFVTLLAIVVVMQLFKSKQSDRNFDSQLFTIDTAKVSTIVITPKGTNEEFRLVRSGNQWSLQWKGKSYLADRSITSGMLAEVLATNAERIAGTEKSEWAQFQLSDSSATKVRIEEGTKTVADFRIGKFSFQQPNSMTTYIRLADDEKVYAVNGFMAMSFNRNPDDLRDKTLVDVNSRDITNVSFSYPADSSFTLIHDKNNWKVNNEPVDSARTAEFINTLSHLTSYNLANDAVLQGKQVFTVSIEGKNFKPIQIKAFEADTTVKYIVTSTSNPGTRFSAKGGELMSKVFVGKRNFRKL